MTMRSRTKITLLMVAGCTAFLPAIPVSGQDTPESLLPPGFGDPAPAPAPSPAPTPAASAGPTPPSSGAAPAPRTVRDSGSGSNTGSSSPSSILDLDTESELGELDDLLRPRYYLPAGQRRSLAQIGVIGEAQGGLPADAFGGEGGNYLTSLIKNIKGPIVSRWGSILLRRALLSKTDSPQNINPADWVAERAWRLLRMGEADSARALVLKVDGGNFTPRLYEVAMQAHLATADPAGICPFVPGGQRASDAPTWTMFDPICASLSGEQSRATVLLRNARRQKVATGIDYLLAEKTIGAGREGRRAVAIKWDDIQYFNNWRYGLGAATGVEPPDRLYEQAGRHVQGWRARAPMLSAESRLKAADIAAAMGVLSNEAMVDLYSAARDDPEVSDDLKARVSLLRQAYVGGTGTERIEAMRSLWTWSSGSLASYSAQVLTANAAARIPASGELPDDSGALIASMLSAGFDRNAARWSTVLPSGSLGWGLLAVAAPGNRAAVTYESLDDFGDNDESEDKLKSKFLLAALTGLDRVDSTGQSEFASDLDLDLGRSSKWTRAISSAAQRGQSGTVALLAAVGMQGGDWSAMSPLHLYHITRALKRVGLEAEARMIAAEAVSRA